MHAQTPALVVHRTPTRIRIKIPNRRRQQTYFAALERVLAEHPDIFRVHLNPLTAGVIIECRKGFDLTAQHRRFLGLEMLEPESALPPSRGYGAPPDEGIDTVAGALIFAPVILKLIVAITTGQVGVQLIEWVIDAFVQAARSEVQRRAAGRRAPLLVAPSD
jgi:hypothetical protein